MRKRFSVFVSSNLPGLVAFKRLYPDVMGLCSTVPALNICLTRICKHEINQDIRNKGRIIDSKLSLVSYDAGK